MGGCAKDPSTGCRLKVKREIVVAIAGQPNVGKSTLFNRLTGAHQHVGNWPGKTVERKEGYRDFAGYRIRFIDLPGTYSLSALGVEEQIARDFLAKEKYDVVVNIVDASNLERNLYLTLQIAELTPRVIIALNMMDLAEQKGLRINVEKLRRCLGVPIVPMVAVKGKGIEELLRTIIDVVENRIEPQLPHITYSPELEQAVDEIENIIRRRNLHRQLGYHPHWLAHKVLEEDFFVLQSIEEKDPDAYSTLTTLIEQIGKRLGGPPSVAMVQARYKLLREICAPLIEKRPVKPTLWERFDALALHPVVGPFFTLFIMLAFFVAVFSINTGFPLNYFLEWLGYPDIAVTLESYSLSGLLGEAFSSLAESMRIALADVPLWVQGLICDGIIAGVGAVVSFAPLIFLIGLGIGALEDSGFLARAAAVMHRPLKPLKIAGKGFIPLLLGFGCNVPSVMMCRGLYRECERRNCALIAGLVPCQARLAVILAIVTAIFSTPLAQIAVITSLYVVALLLLWVIGVLFAHTLFRREPSAQLVIELPPYRAPFVGNVLMYGWNLTKHFLKKAGTIIFLLAILMWFSLSYGPAGFTEDPSLSYAALLGHALTPFTRVFGASHWVLVLALITGFIAKEAVIETVALAAGTPSISEALGKLGVTPLQAYSLLLVVTIYIPCLATIATIWSETRSWRYVLLTILYMTGIALLLATLVYQLGAWLGF